SPRIVRVVLFALAGLVGADERVGPGAIRVRLAAPLEDQVLARGLGRHDALTQLTAEHEMSRWTDLRGGSCPEGMKAPLGLTRGVPLKVSGTKAAKTTIREKTNCQSTHWWKEQGWVPSKGTMAERMAQPTWSVKKQLVEDGHRVEPLLLLSVGSEPKG